MEGGNSDIGDVVEGGHFGVGGDESQVVPPLRGSGPPFKGERRMVPMRITGREVLIQGNHVHGGGGAPSWWWGSRCRCQTSFSSPHWVDMIPKGGSTVLTEGMRWRARKIGEGHLQLSSQLCGPPLLAECSRPLKIPHVDVNECGGGVQTLCLVYPLPHKQATRVGGLMEGVRGGGGGRAWYRPRVLASGSGRLPTWERAIWDIA